jgi:flagellar biosynthesis GTPase FlhF
MNSLLTQAKLATAWAELKKGRHSTMAKSRKQTTSKATTKRTTKASTKQAKKSTKKKTTSQRTRAKKAPAKNATVKKATIKKPVKQGTEVAAEETQDQSAAAKPERRASNRRKVQRRRQIDPTTCERDYSNEEIEFMRAMDEYKRNNGRMFPTCSEILEVVRALGYVRQHQAKQPLVGQSAIADGTALQIPAETQGKPESTANPIAAPLCNSDASVICPTEPLDR